MPTRTIRQAGGDFSTLAAALADAGTVANDIMSIEGLWTVDDTAAATVSDNNITIETDEQSNPHGVYDESNEHYRLVVSDGNHCLTVNNTGLIVEKVAIVQDGGGASDECVRITPIGTFTFLDLILRSTTTTSDQDGIFYGPDDGTINIENCIAYNFGRAAFHSQGGANHTQTWNINSSTAWNCTLGAGEPQGGGIAVDASGAGTTITVNIFNCAFLDCNVTGGSEDYNEDLAVATVIWDIHNSICSDSSITGRDAGAVDALENRTATDNTAPGAGDFVIFQDITTTPFNLLLFDNAVDNDAQDAHSALTGAGLTLPILDIVGDTRDRGANEVDIGADSITASPPPPSLLPWPEYGQGRADIGNPSVYGATIVRS